MIFKVRTIYSEIRERMSSVEEKLVQYKLVVEHLLKNETSDGANYQVSTCSHLVWFGGFAPTTSFLTFAFSLML